MFAHCTKVQETIVPIPELFHPTTHNTHPTKTHTHLITIIIIIVIIIIRLPP